MGMAERGGRTLNAKLLSATIVMSIYALSILHHGSPGLLINDSDSDVQNSERSEVAALSISALTLVSEDLFAGL